MFSAKRAQGGEGADFLNSLEDHVLRPDERAPTAVQSTAHYIFENPVRQDLAPRWQDYPFSGALLPGYCALDPRSENFWPFFWQRHNETQL